MAGSLGFFENRGSISDSVKKGKTPPRDGGDAPNVRTSCAKANRYDFISVVHRSSAQSLVPAPPRDRLRHSLRDQPFSSTRISSIGLSLTGIRVGLITLQPQPREHFPLSGF
jgi:hypothetical protein